jgi:hypothetical protein
MPSRSARRRRSKHIAHVVARAAGLDEGGRRARAAWYLARWRAEAHRRADDLNAAAVWALNDDKQALARALDPTGELAGDLARACAEAVARAAGHHLVGGSRPLADRSRVQVGRTGPGR